MFVRSAGALQPGRELRLRSAVGASVAGHALLLAGVLALSAIRGKPIETEPVVRVHLNLGPIRNPAPPRPAAPPAASAPTQTPLPAPQVAKPKLPATPAAPTPPPRLPAPKAPAAPALKPPRPAAPKAPVMIAARSTPSPPVAAPPAAESTEADTTASESALDRALRRVRSEPSEDSGTVITAQRTASATSGVGATATPGGGGAFDGQTADLVARYAALIRAAVESACQVPAGIPRDEVSDAVVQLRVDAAGRVLSFTLARSSGFAALDEVLRSVFARITLPAPPAEVAARAQRGGLRIVFPFAAR